MEVPLISIVIPTCNRANDLLVCVAALVDKLPADESVEMLVCDDGRSSETKVRLAQNFPMVAWHQGPKIGPAANRNMGARNARGQWLIFFDDDIIPEPACLAGYLTAIGRQSAGSSVLCGATCRAETPSSLLWEAPHNPDGAILISCNMALPKSLFLELQGFDERFPTAAFEDTEFEARVRFLSIPIEFVPEAKVYHPLRTHPSPSGLARRWEARVIYAYDLGATPAKVLWRLPVHVAKVIVSRFRSPEWKWNNLRAACNFAAEFALVLWHLPRWLGRHWAGSRSRFWAERRSSGKLHPKFGF